MKTNAWKTALVIGLALLPLFFAACPGEQSSVPYYPQVSRSSQKTTISGTVDYKEAGSPVPVSRVYAGSAPVYTEATRLGHGAVSAGAYSLQIARPVTGKTVYFFVSATTGAYVNVGQTTISGGAATAEYNIAYNRLLTTVSGSVSLTVNSASVAPAQVILSASPNLSPGSVEGVLGYGTVSGGGPYTYTADITRPESVTTVYVYVHSGSILASADPAQISIPANATTVLQNVTCTITTTTISGNFDYKENGGPAALMMSGLYVSSSPTWSASAVLGLGGITPGSPPNPDTYSADILRPSENLTVYFYIPIGTSDDSVRVQVGSTTVTGGAAAKTYDISYNNTNVTTLSGSLTYKVNGAPGTWLSPIIASTSASVSSMADLSDSLLASAMPSGTSYTLSFPRFAKTTRVYIYVYTGTSVKLLGNVQVGSKSVNVTHDLTWDHQITSIHGTISGNGASGLASQMIYFLSAGGITTVSVSDLMGGGSQLLGTALVSSGSPYTYSGYIDRPAATKTVYLYRVTGLNGYDNMTVVQVASESVTHSDTDKTVDFTVN
jgi:hypothetical protein